MGCPLFMAMLVTGGANWPVELVGSAPAVGLASGVAVDVAVGVYVDAGASVTVGVTVRVGLASVSMGDGVAVTCTKG